MRIFRFACINNIVGYYVEELSWQNENKTFLEIKHWKITSKTKWGSSIETRDKTMKPVGARNREFYF